MAGVQTCWWDLRDRREARDVAVAFSRPEADRCVAAWVSSPSLDVEVIAASMEAALDLDEKWNNQPDDVQVTLVCGSTSIPVASPRLARVGGALFERASKVF